jgi:hypothetical protein
MSMYYKGNKNKEEDICMASGHSVEEMRNMYTVLVRKLGE